MAAMVPWYGVSTVSRGLCSCMPCSAPAHPGNPARGMRAMLMLMLMLRKTGRVQAGGGRMCQSGREGNGKREPLHRHARLEGAEHDSALTLRCTCTCACICVCV